MPNSHNDKVEVKLTYSELVKILCNLAVRVERLEDLLLEFLPQSFEQYEFLTIEILKAELSTMQQAKKILPYKRWAAKRIKELDDSLKGFITYYHEDKERKKPKPKYD